MNDAPFTIDGFGPLSLVRPTTIGALGEFVREATADRPLYPTGGQTQLALGGTPAKAGIALDLRGLDQVIDFPARDMTITVQAGITLGRLDALLAPENLRLPIDVPQRDTATLGGAIATNSSGHRRFGYGTLRDYVIGISAINDVGNEFKAGGRVVKNVAGYDLCKLLIGSMGTLGVISQVTLKLRPRAEERALVCIPCRTEQVAMLLDQLLASRTRPVILDLVNRTGGRSLHQTGEAECIAIVGYEGNSDAVKWQMQHLVKELGVNFKMEARVGYTGQPLDQALTEWSSSAAARMTLKACMRPSGIADFVKAAETWGGQPALRAHAGNGIVVGHYAGDLLVDAAKRLVEQWRGAATAVVVQKCPPTWKPALGVWGPPSADIAVMREVKSRFDPRNIFNPGRFVV